MSLRKGCERLARPRAWPSRKAGLFFSWGGGNLDSYTEAGKLVDLDPGLESHFLPSALQGGIYNGKLIGVPMRGTQPVFIFYNKNVFAKAGLQPPTTYAELTSLVTAFKSKGIIPFTISGTATNSWTELMWIEYLVDRLAGPGLFKKLSGGTGRSCCTWLLYFACLIGHVPVACSLLTVRLSGRTYPTLLRIVRALRWSLVAGRWSLTFAVGCCCHPYYLRSGPKLARISSEKSCGCSQAAKWPPRSSLL